MSLQGLFLLSLKGHWYCTRFLKAVRKQILHLPSRMARRKIGEIMGWSAYLDTREGGGVNNLEYSSQIC